LAKFVNWGNLEQKLKNVADIVIVYNGCPMGILCSRLPTCSSYSLNYPQTLISWLVGQGGGAGVGREEILKLDPVPVWAKQPSQINIVVEMLLAERDKGALLRPVVFATLTKVRQAKLVESQSLPRSAGLLGWSQRIGDKYIGQMLPYKVGHVTAAGMEAGPEAAVHAGPHADRAQNSALALGIEGPGHCP
jgi:hypothetical protein